MYHLSDYDYTLPEHLIAQYPTQPADHARLLVVDTDQVFCRLTNAHVYDLPEILDPHTLMILNDTKVIKARIPLNDIAIKLSTGKETILEH
jgi:S-adenosylmethionine:tRNA ribosyltransferase-isomerase